jgi:hypothetical protein
MKMNCDTFNDDFDSMTEFENKEIYDEPKVWKTKEGKILQICEMETSHILNCLNMLDRNGYMSAKGFISIMNVDYDSMPDGAQMAFDDVIDEVCEKLPVTVYNYLLEELEERGVERS